MSRSPNSPSQGVLSSLARPSNDGNPGKARADDASTVETHRRAKSELEGSKERHPATPTEPDDADRLVGEPLLVQVSDRRADVHDDARIGETFEELSHLLEVAVGRRAAARPVEERGRDPVVSGIREAPGDVLDVLDYTARLVDDDHGPGRATFGHARVQPHTAVDDVEHDVGDLHALVLARPASCSFYASRL